MRFSIRQILWFVGPLLGLTSIFVSVLLSGASVLHSASYKPTIASLYFIAVTLAAGALADAFEYAVYSDRAHADGLGVALAAVGFLFNIVFLFINTALFVYAIKTYSIGSKETDFWDVGAPFASVALAFIFGFVFKTAADRTR